MLAFSKLHRQKQSSIHTNRCLMTTQQYSLPNSITNVHELEQVLGGLLIPNSQVVQAAEQILRNFTADARCLPAFFTTLQASHNPGVRQMAAIMMRSYVKLWNSIDEQSKNTIKVGLLDCLLKERTYVL